MISYHDGGVRLNYDIIFLAVYTSDGQTQVRTCGLCLATVFILLNTLKTHGTSWSWRNIYYYGTRKTITTMRRAIACGDERGRDIPVGATYILYMLWFLAIDFSVTSDSPYMVYCIRVVIILKSCLVIFSGQLYIALGTLGIPQYHNKTRSF